MGDGFGPAMLQRPLWPLNLMPVGILRGFVRTASMVTPSWMLCRHHFPLIEAKS
jgi:hypothetical protein